MRAGIAAVLAILLITLGVCAVVTKRASKSMSSYVARLLVCLMPPMLGNLIIILSSDPVVATVGCYMYFIGMDFTMFALFNYTMHYCWQRKTIERVNRSVHILVLVDIVQLVLNLFLGHAFSTQPIVVDGAPYYMLVPYWGQTIHRILDYGIFVFCLGQFTYSTLTSPRIYVERYLVILLVMIFIGGWQSFFVFSGTPVNSSMIGYGIFGLLVFYFTMFYRPMRLLDRMLACVVSDLDVSFFFFDLDDTCIYANKSAEELVDLDIMEIVRAPEELQKRMGHLSLVDEGEWTIQRRVGRGKDARFYSLEYRHVFDRQQRQVGSYLSVRDRTDEEYEQREEVFFARHDRLTGLFNKEFLYERARQMLDANPNEQYVVAAFDVRDFKIVNDVFGKEFGDYALVSLARFLQSISSSDALYGRLSGDKFGLITPKSQFHPGSIDRKLGHFTVSDGERSHAIVLHVGVYEVEEMGLSISVMFDRAFLAIASIKNSFSVHVAYYGEDMRNEVLWSQTISDQLEKAISERQIVPYLQPIVDNAGTPVGAEVLVRWIHPAEGFLSPARFVPVLERNGMIAELDYYMWQCACELLCEWQSQGIDLFLSINISPLDFYFMDVYEALTGLMDEYCIEPRKLRLEITETVMMTDVESRMQILEKLRSYGFLVEMDDFGSGYSSLNMLKDMPVDLLKIDMMFLYKSKNHQKAETILRSIMDLTKNLEIQSLTEGVETREQFGMLRQMGCQLYQGYYFAKPMSVEQFKGYCRL